MDPTINDDGYDAFIAACVRDCRCCTECHQDSPCAGVMAGGLCDDMCCCDEEHMREHWDDGEDDDP